MKLQYLFLPALLWLAALISFLCVPPRNPLIIILFIIDVGAALFLTLRLFFSKKTVLTAVATTLLFLFVSAFAGFSLVNTLLILVIGVIISLIL